MVVLSVENMFNSLKYGCYSVDLLNNAWHSGSYLADLTFNTWLCTLIYYMLVIGNTCEGLTRQFVENDQLVNRITM